ncbi:MAG: hypothetical protein WA705_13915 [Candidatus Ozemobacteraceae bacterium]
MKTGVVRDFDLTLGVGNIHYDPDITSKALLNYNFSALYHAQKDLTCELYGTYVGESQTTASVVTGKTLTGGNVTKTFPYKLGDYTDLNLVLRKRITNDLGFGQNITLAIRNLLNKRYESTVFTPVYGRHVSLTYDFEF